MNTIEPTTNHSDAFAEVDTNMCNSDVHEQVLHYKNKFRSPQNRWGNIKDRINPYVDAMLD